MWTVGARFLPKSSGVQLPGKAYTSDASGQDEKKGCIPHANVLIMLMSGFEFLPYHTLGLALSSRDQVPDAAASKASASRLVFTGPS